MPEQCRHEAVRFCGFRTIGNRQRWEDKTLVSCMECGTTLPMAAILKQWARLDTERAIERGEA